jgi:sigma-B regulation protein RsbU (phosphoserine phosphatase)
VPVPYRRAMRARIVASRARASLLRFAGWRNSCVSSTIRGDGGHECAATARSFTWRAALSCATAQKRPMIAGDLPHNEVERLRAVQQHQILDTPPDGTFDRIVRLAAKIFNVPIALVTIVDQDRIWFKARHGLDNVFQIPRDPGLCASAICDDEPYIIENARQDIRSMANPLVAGGFGLQFYAAAQLRTHDGHNLGTLCILDRKPRVFGSSESGTLEMLAGVVVDEMELRLATLRTVASERQLVIDKDHLYQRERRVAASLQEAMLPDQLPDVSQIQFSSLYLPASDEAAVGGDWFDALLLDKNHLLVSIGDVTGHGINAATLMGKVRQSLRAIALNFSDPADILFRLDRVLRYEDQHRIVTSFVAIVDLDERTLAYASAGHPPPLLRAPGGSVTILSTTGTPLGLRGTEEPQSQRLSIAPGSLLVMYTDGLIEQSRDIIAGEKALLETVRQTHIVHATDPAAAIKEALLPGDTADDVAIMTAYFS